MSSWPFLAWSLEASNQAGATQASSDSRTSQPQQGHLRARQQACTQPLGGVGQAWDVSRWSGASPPGRRL